MSRNLNISGVLDEAVTEGGECGRKMASGRGFEGAIRYIVNAMICSLSVLETCIKQCLYLFLCMTVRQCYGRRKRGVEFVLYRWTTSEACLVLRGRIEPRMHGQGTCAE